ncbi:1-phosphofructokinase [Amycolatopsis sp. H20-H5]|uniref:1-phosphofructokinase n=1 Tax=Amycolatopsis sp. H20-H5 TaxID=3046309 RepID=UPI002DBB869C|nr:1-phosphofructokinase [Amycolatopsis sp. H20-H5]MEC3981281.1 1-phosphofructokinase [Amycolatopsis sp. H20-H5]
MIVTVTANPSLDRTLEVAGLRRGQVHRISAAHVQPGGKGVNVARALVSNGIPARAIIPAGGVEGQQLIALLTDYDIEVCQAPSTGPVRINVSVVEPDATVTKLNEPGAALSETEVAALFDVILANIADASWVVLAGSLPPGIDPGFYAEVIRRLDGKGIRVAVDTSGAALYAAVAAGPALIKPNREELEEVVGRKLPTVADIGEAARELRGFGVETVLASLGGDGALLVDAEGMWHAEAPAVVRSTVGAGDATLAGFLAAGAHGVSALRQGVAWGAAAVSLPGSTMPRPRDIRQESVRVRARIDGGRLLQAG